MPDGRVRRRYPWEEEEQIPPMALQRPPMRRDIPPEIQQQAPPPPGGAVGESMPPPMMQQGPPPMAGMEAPPPIAMQQQAPPMNINVAGPPPMATPRTQQMFSDIDKLRAEKGPPVWRQALGAALSTSPRLRGVSGLVSGDVARERKMERLKLSQLAANEEQQVGTQQNQQAIAQENARRQGLVADSTITRNTAQTAAANRPQRRTLSPGQTVLGDDDEPVYTAPAAAAVPSRTIEGRVTEIVTDPKIPGDQKKTQIQALIDANNLLHPEKPITHFTTDDKGNITAVSVKPGEVADAPGGRMPLGPGGQTKTPLASATPQAQNNAKDIAQSIIEGKQPPTLTGLYRAGAEVRAELARSGYDLMSAQRDWQAIQKHLATLNGQQQERLRQAITFTHDSLDNIGELYNEWKTLGGATGFKILNRAALSGSKQLPGKMGEVATNLESQINDLTSELGTVYKGGNASTDESLKLAAENLKGDWNEQTFKRAMDQIRKNLTIRKNSILSSAPVGVSEDSPYLPHRKEAADTAAPGSSGSGQFTVTDPRGKNHLFPNQKAADDFKKAAGIK